MKRHLLSLVVAAGLPATSTAIMAGPAHANLLSDEDFQSATPLSGSGMFPLSDFGVWHVLGTNYTKSTPGQGGATDVFAQHATAGNGSDLRLVQIIDAAAAAHRRQHVNLCARGKTRFQTGAPAVHEHVNVPPDGRP